MVRITKHLTRLALLAIATMLPQLANAQKSIVNNSDNAGGKSAITVNDNSTSAANAPNLKATNTQTIQVGYGTEKNEVAPVFNWWKSSYTGNEHIYVKNDLTGLKAGDKIVSLSYQCISGSASGGNFNVRMKNTSKNAFNSNSSATDFSVLEVGYNEQVYGNVTLGSYSAGDWIVFDLDEPFVYNGQNIIIDIRNTAPATSQGWCYFASTENDCRRGIAWRNANSENVESSGFHGAYDPYGQYDAGIYEGNSTEHSNVPNVRISYIPGNIYATDIYLSQSSLNLEVGNTATLTATVLPSNATNKNVTWSSSNTAIATVNQYGTVTAKATGNATIKATTTDGTNLSASCLVTVKPKTILATSITLNQSELNMVEGDEAMLSATVLPNNTTNPGVLWSSSNQNVAIVNSSGKVTAKTEGTATITAKTVDGSNLTASCQVTVNEEEGWVMLTPDFNKTIMFKKFRIKPNATGTSNYVEIKFSPLPNAYAEAPSLGINTYTGWLINEADGTTTNTSSMTSLDNGWFEYEHPSYLCYYDYQRNTKWGTVKVFVEYPGTINGDVNGDGSVNSADVTTVYKIILGN